MARVSASTDTDTDTWYLFVNVDYTELSLLILLKIDNLQILGVLYFLLKGILMAHSLHFVRDYTLAPNGVTERALSRDVPALSKEDVRALASIRTSANFTLENSTGMYAGVKRLRPKK